MFAFEFPGRVIRATSCAWWCGISTEGEAARA
jgi:hypothetical protein